MPKWGVLWIFWRFRAATQVYIIHKVAPRTELSLCDPDREFGREFGTGTAIGFRASREH